MPELEENSNRYIRYRFPAATGATFVGLEDIEAKTTPIVTTYFAEPSDVSDTPEFLAQIVGTHGLAVSVRGEVEQTGKETRKVEEALTRHYADPGSGNLVGIITYVSPETPELEGMVAWVPSPFDELRAQRDTYLAHIVSYVAESLDLSYSQKLSDRLKFLLEIAKDEQELVATESLINLLSFLKSEMPLACPKVFLTPRGNFRAQWRKTPEQHFAMEFLPSGKTRYVLFAADLEQPNLIARTAAITSRDAVMKSVEVYGVRDWMSK